MAVTDLPQNLILTPAPSQNNFTYERGSQAYGIISATGTVTQSGTAAPAAGTLVSLTLSGANGSTYTVSVPTNNVFGIVAVTAYGDQPSNIVSQVDINLFSGTGSFSALTVNLLGSLDGKNFYVLAQMNNASGGIFPGAGIAGVRYLAFSITTATVSSGAPTATVSFTMGQ